MYIPPYYRINDRKKIVSFMRAYNFGLLISAPDNIPEATHLPFIIEDNGKEIKLISHLAAVNPQAKNIESEKEALVVFSEPHAYISPSHYESKINVPTWNYAAVHAYGKPVILNSDKEKIETLEKMISFYEKDYMAQWKSLPEKYVSGMLKEIVAFEIPVIRMDAKHKLSQNKTKKEQQNIIEEMQKSDDSLKRTIAEMMKENLK